MRMDLLEYNIKSNSSKYRATRTEFSLVRLKVDLEKSENVYKGYKPLTGNYITEIILSAAKLPQVNINDLLIMKSVKVTTGHFNKTKNPQ